MELSEALTNATIKIQHKAGGFESSLSDGTIERPACNELVSSFLGVENPSQADAAKINEIYDWAKTKSGESDADLVALLRDVRFKLGSSASHSLLERLHRYVALRQKAGHLEAQAEAMEQ